jgi:hypothetical protein
MALDDRERNFEKALARELRAGALNGLKCPDAETLAAYHERMLSPEEMFAQKSHIAGCTRCQEILATLEMTEAIPVVERDSGEVVAAAAATAAARPAEAASVSVRAKSGSVREMPKRRIYLKWVVPAGAIAAGLLVWVAVHDSRAPKMQSQSTSVEVAENRESGKADLGSPKTAAREALPPPAAADKAAARLQDNEKQELDALVAGDQAKALKRGRASGGASYDHGPRLAQNQIQNQIQNNGQFTAQNRPSETFDKKVNELPLTRRNVGGVTRENAPARSESAMKAAPTAPAAAPPPVPPPSFPAGAGTGAGAAAAPPTKPADADARKDETVRPMSETVEVTAAASVTEIETKAADKEKAALKKMNAADAFGVVAGGNLRDSNAGGLTVIATPDPKVMWIISVNGAVLKTEDGEKSFRQQQIGEGMNVLAGSAVNKKICWLIAEKGIVLRTTDGGKHWTTLNAPSGANFTAIKAVSATEATITDASGKVSYSTVDGGATWNAVARQ